MRVGRAARRALVGSVVLLPAVTWAAAAQSFDGVSTFVTRNDDGQTNTMTQYTKGQKFRIDTNDPKDPENSGSFIIDGTTQTTTFLMPKNKQYLQFTGQDVRNFAAKMKPVADSLAKDPTVKSMTQEPASSHPA